MMQLITTNFLTFAMQHYDNPACRNVSEFSCDLDRIKYVKKLIRRYQKSGELRYRLLINHLIILSNVFGIDASTRMLFEKLDSGMHSLLKTFLVFLNIFPEELEKITAHVPLDEDVQRVLEGI